MVSVTSGFNLKVYIRGKYLSGVFCQRTLGVPDHMKVFYMIIINSVKYSVKGNIQIKN
jgi:hypothetical protein